MAEQLLDRAQVGAALEQVGGGGVAQAVGADVGRPGTSGDAAVDQVADGRWSIRRAPRAEEERRPRALDPQHGRPDRQPPVDRPAGRGAVGHRALLAALAEHPDHPAFVVDVVDVEADELARPGSRWRRAAPASPRRASRPGCRHRPDRRPPDQGLGLVGAQHRRQRLVRLGRRRARRPGRLGSRPVAVQPRGEDPGGGGAPRDRRTCAAGRLQPGQPAAQRARSRSSSSSSPAATQWSSRLAMSPR